MTAHLYLHTPFCAKICPYCAFYVHRGGAELQRDFVQALRREIENWRREEDDAVETIYFGGGTPSLLAAELFVELASSLPSCPAGEVTLEVNPATVTEEKAKAWARAGVNRISLGAQSFDADYLRLLGRQHRPEEIGETVALLRAHGFRNINLDLMFALPNQPESIWRTTLEAALALQPEHISAYALTYEEDTPFFQQRAAGQWKMDEAREIRMFEETAQRLSAAGCAPYEISNFARPGFESRHNQAYWLGHDYRGFGPSAYSTVGLQRWHNVRDTRAYVEKLRRDESVMGEREPLTEVVKRRERLMFGLRMREGVALAELEQWPEIAPRLVAEELATAHDGRLMLTSRGRLVADSVAELFV